MIDRRSLIAAMLIMAVLCAGARPYEVRAQSTPRPSYAGIEANSVGYDPATNEYVFMLGRDTLYWYRDGNAPVFDGTGATLAALRARTPDGRRSFRPSWTGGPTVEFMLSDRSVEKVPSDAVGGTGVTFSRESPTQRSSTGDTVITRWMMTYRGTSFRYQYRMTISGRTLVIGVDALDSTGMASGFICDRCDSALNPHIVKIPYLSLFNVLSCDSGFVSAFFDWETTRSSRYTPWWRTGESAGPHSARFAPVVEYAAKTDGSRNPLHEIIYITVARSLDEVLPNLPGPSAPQATRDTLANRTILSYHAPFPWLRDRNRGSWYRYLETLRDQGVENLAVIIKEWQYGTSDHKLPHVLPANDYRWLKSSGPCNGQASGSALGTRMLAACGKLIKDTLHFDFAVHENYADFYPGPAFLTADCSLLPDGSLALGTTGNCSGDTSYRIRPDRVLAYDSTWARRIRDSVGPNWSYLDVHSSINPCGYQGPTNAWDFSSGVVDFNASRPNAGTFTGVLDAYRRLPAVQRGFYKGPVQGEGGNQMLYAGYFDDFDGRLFTADARVRGVNAPLLVDFDLLKVRPKSSQHGVGHIGDFFQDAGGADYDTLSRNSVQRYVATELAFGHGGLVTKSGSHDQSIYHAKLEQECVRPVMHSLAHASPISIRYGDDFSQDASSYITAHPGYWDKDSPDFMCRIRIEYSNGVIIYVNRGPSGVTVRVPTGGSAWVTFNDAIRGIYAGAPPGDPVLLKAHCGWACYVPSSR